MAGRNRLKKWTGRLSAAGGLSTVFAGAARGDERESEVYPRITQKIRKRKGGARALRQRALEAADGPARRIESLAHFKLAPSPHLAFQLSPCPPIPSASFSSPACPAPSLIPKRLRHFSASSRAA